MIQTLVAATRQQNDAALTRAFRVVFALFACTAMLAVATLFVAWSQGWDLKLAVGGVGFVGGMLAFVTVGATFVLTLLAELRVGALCQWVVELEGNAKGAPSPYLPEPETTKPPITTGVSNPEAIGGIDSRDLAFLCRYLVRRNKWTAEILEGIELPHSHIVITNKDTRDGQGNLQSTTYKRIMKLFEDSDVIVGRTRGETGTLTETNPDEMLRKIRGIGVAR